MHAHPSTSRPPFFRFAVRAAMLLVLGGLVASCDRHPAQETPENYGHGSSHNKATPDHQIDSKVGSRHFSDTAGTKDEAGEGEGGHDKPAGSPTPTASPKVL